jgi:hypothetical protein
MATVTCPPSPVKPDRKVNWVWRNAEVGYGVLRITEKVGRKATTDSYFILPVPSDWGRAFEVTKLVPGQGGAARYFVNLGGEGEPASCECKGWLAHGRCRHVEALTALRLAGRLLRNHPRGRRPSPPSGDHHELSSRP